MCCNMGFYRGRAVSLGYLCQIIGLPQGDFTVGGAFLLRKIHQFKMFFVVFFFVAFRRLCLLWSFDTVNRVDQVNLVNCIN